MTFYSSILGIPIICSQDNVKIGVVKEVLFCSKKGLIFGLIIEERSIFKAIKYISIDNIKEVNEISIMTYSVDCITKLKHPEDFCNKLDSINKTNINTFAYSKDRKLIGQVRDVIFDFKKHSIEGYVISKSYFEDILLKRVILKNNVEIDENFNKFIVLDY